MVNTGAVHSTAKRKNGASLGTEQDVLLIDSPFQLSLLARALIVSGDDTAFLPDVHHLGTLPAVRPSGMNCPVASDVRGRPWAIVVLPRVSNSRAKKTRCNFLPKIVIASSNHRWCPEDSILYRVGSVQTLDKRRNRKMTHQPPVRTGPDFLVLQWLTVRLRAKLVPRLPASLPVEGSLGKPALDRDEVAFGAGIRVLGAGGVPGASRKARDAPAAT